MFKVLLLNFLLLIIIKNKSAETAETAESDAFVIKRRVEEALSHCSKIRGVSSQELDLILAKLRDLAQKTSSTPRVIILDPMLFIGFANILKSYRLENEAQAIYRAVLAPRIGLKDIEQQLQVCFHLADLGEVAFVINKIESLINNKTLTYSEREGAIRTFYLIDPDEHREEARCRMIELIKETSKVSNEEAQKKAATYFLDERETRQQIREFVGV